MPERTSVATVHRLRPAQAPSWWRIRYPKPGNFIAGNGDYLVMYLGKRCDDVRVALSARIDGEPLGFSSPELVATGDAGVLDRHLEACADCREWLANAEQVTRLVRLQPLDVPDLTQPIMAAVAADAAGAPSGTAGPVAAGSVAASSVAASSVAASSVAAGRRQVLRVAVAAVAVAQLLLVLPTLLSSLGFAVPAHTRHELATFDVALAAGLLLAAWRPALAPAYLPIVWIVAVGLAGTALIDVVHGTTTFGQETGHLAALVQAVLLWALSRTDHRRRRSALAA
jgi:predicted anti-sigma-YlaC factor YlaD